MKQIRVHFNYRLVNCYECSLRVHKCLDYKCIHHACVFPSM